jgi:hypothetical protein
LGIISSQGGEYMTVSDEGIIYTEVFELARKWAETEDPQKNHQSIKLFAAMDPFNMPDESWSIIKTIADRYISNQSRYIYQDTEYLIFEAILKYYWWLDEFGQREVKDLINNFPGDILTKEFYKKIAPLQNIYTDGNQENSVNTPVSLDGEICENVDVTEVKHRIKELEKSLKDIVDTIGKNPERYLMFPLLQQDIKRIEEKIYNINQRLDDWKGNLEKRIEDIQGRKTYSIGKWQLIIAIFALFGLPTLFVIVVKLVRIAMDYSK